MRFTRAIVAAALIAGPAVGVATGVAVLRQTPIYQSAAILLIDQPGQIARSTSEGILLKLNQLRAKYAVLARTNRLTGPVASKLNLSQGEVGRAVTVTLPGPSLVLIVSARTSRPVSSQQIADAMGDELIAFLAAEQEATMIPMDQRIVMSKIETAQLGVKLEPTRGRALLVGIIAGMLALIVAFVGLQLVPRRRDEA